MKKILSSHHSLRRRVVATFSEGDQRFEVDVVAQLSLYHAVKHVRLDHGD